MSRAARAAIQAIDAIPTRKRRFRPYPAYRNSDVEWLGNIPAHWQPERLKFVARFGYGDSLSAENRSPGEVSVYGSNGIVGTHDTPNTLGPCIVVGRKGSFGKLAYSQDPCFAIDTTYFIDRRVSAHDLRWLYYCLECLNLDAFSKDSAVPGLAREDAYSRIVPLPSPQEERSIAAFLDRETARIDELVARKTRIIELLGEKRSAKIAFALTHPSSRQRDTVRVKHLLRFTTSGSRGWAEFYADEGDLFIQSGNLDRRLGLDLTNVHRIVPPAGAEVERTRIRRFDVLVCITGAYTGNVCVIEDDLPRAFVNQHLALLRPRQERVVPRFLAYYLSSSIGQGHFRAAQYGGTKQGLGFEDIHSIPVVLPSLGEQRAIVAELDRQCRQIEELATFIRGGIAQLGEYRSTLISAAVTGKIDVHEEAMA